MTLQGSIIAVATPMHENGEVDYFNFQHLIEWQLEQGCDGIVVAGSTGEAATLTHDEKCALFACAQRVVEGKVPVIAGTGSNCTRASIELTKMAYELGIQYSLITCPYYNKPTQNGLYLHYQTIAETIPQMQHILYSIPGRSVIRIDVDTVVKLSTLPNIIGIKDSGSTAERIRQLRASCGPDFSLLSGDDDFTLTCMRSGGDGVISVVANATPKTMQTLVKAYLAGDAKQAEQADELMQGLYKELFCQSNPIPLKALLHHMGKIEKGIRLPLTWLEPQYEQAVFAAYESCCD